MSESKFFDFAQWFWAMRVGESKPRTVDPVAIADLRAFLDKWGIKQLWEVIEIYAAHDPEIVASKLEMEVAGHKLASWIMEANELDNGDFSFGGTTLRSPYGEGRLVQCWIDVTDSDVEFYQEEPPTEPRLKFYVDDDGNPRPNTPEES